MSEEYLMLKPFLSVGNEGSEVYSVKSHVLIHRLNSNTISVMFPVYNKMELRYDEDSKTVTPIYFESPEGVLTTKTMLIRDFEAMTEDLRERMKMLIDIMSEGGIL